MGEQGCPRLMHTASASGSILRQHGWAPVAASLPGSMEGLLLPFLPPTSMHGGAAAASLAVSPSELRPTACPSMRSRDSPYSLSHRLVWFTLLKDRAKTQFHGIAFQWTSELKPSFMKLHFSGLKSYMRTVYAQPYVLTFSQNRQDPVWLPLFVYI